MNIQAFQKDVEEDVRPDEGEHHQPSPRPDVGTAADRVHSGDAARSSIIDEPQNMESDAAAAAIARLNPFCTLRYSATHKRAYNRVYRLGPVDAYDMNLVKRIEVASVVADDNPNAAFVRLMAVDVTKLRAQVTINHGAGSAFKAKKVWVKAGDDLSVHLRRAPGVRQRLDRVGHLIPRRGRGSRVHQRLRGHDQRGVGILRRRHPAGPRSSRRSGSTSTRSGRSRR